MARKQRVNQEITAREVRLVGAKGEQLGIMPLEQAREVARNNNLDLVEVAATAVPPVCRLLDYGKYKYEQAKKGREAKKSQRVSMLREVRLRPKIGDHDFQAKARLARKLLEGGDKVKITVMFRGREITHPEIAWRLLQRMAESLEDIASVEGQPLMVGRRMNVVMVPLSAQKAKKVEEQKAKKVEEQKAKKVEEKVRKS
ncbi:MAG: translation initiation factor IF-3 [Dehalococcoidales bacterium]|nr:MAG: translation initiation factor IF-3 [Dehalococcoidales bacterium]